LAKTVADDGILSVASGGFPAALEKHCGAWLATSPDIPVVMAGMVGSRNGWVEAPYRQCPAAVSDIAASMISVSHDERHRVWIVPGLSTRDSSGTPDVLRGEETLAIGTGLTSGLVVLPGTHSKWVRMDQGRIVGFATFMTGELYATLLSDTILGRLREEPDDQVGFAKGLQAASGPGGLSHQAFSARTTVLMGDLSGHSVASYISGLLIGSEIIEGFAMEPDAEKIIVVAEGAIAEAYELAFRTKERNVSFMTPDSCFIEGLRRLGASRLGKK
jgi:2-dehydro-3-deoxygalactonokinase